MTLVDLLCECNNKDYELIIRNDLGTSGYFVHLYKITNKNIRQTMYKEYGENIVKLLSHVRRFL